MVEKPNKRFEKEAHVKTKFVWKRGLFENEDTIYHGQWRIHDRQNEHVLPNQAVERR